MTCIERSCSRKRLPHRAFCADHLARLLARVLGRSAEYPVVAA